MKYSYKPSANLAPTIITGALKGMKLKVPDSARPFTGRVKQSVFDALTNYLQTRMQGASVLDLFAGSGNLGLEAISRGAGSATFVEINSKACAAITENIRKANVTDKCKVINTSVVNFLSDNSEQFDVIFVDPPFELAQTLSISLLPRALKQAGVVILKLPRRTSMQIPPGLTLATRDEIGTNEIWYLTKSND